MSATTQVDIGAMIWRMPTPTGDRPCVAGTGVSIKAITSWYKMGLMPEQILVKYSDLSLAQVYAALTYYHANRGEIDAATVEDKRAEREGAASSRANKP